MGASLRCATARVFKKLDAARRNPGAASPLENDYWYFYWDHLDPYLLTHVMDPNLNMTIYDHDEMGNLTSVTDKLGNKTTFVYFDSPTNPKHRNLIAEITDPP